MYPAAIMQQPITTIVLIIIVSLLNSYFYRIPTTSTGLAAPAPDHPLEARPVSDINYRAIGATAGRTLTTFCIFHSTSSFPLKFNFSLKLLQKIIQSAIPIAFTGIKHSYPLLVFQARTLFFWQSHCTVILAKSAFHCVHHLPLKVQFSYLLAL